MSDSNKTETLILLKRCRAGDATALAELTEHLETDLRGRARSAFSGERAGHTLQPTALVNEAFIRLARSPQADWKDRAHFLAVASKVMERVLIDHARRHETVKRGRGVDIVPLDSQDPRPTAGGELHDVLAVHQALQGLERLSERQAAVARMRAFGGLTNAEIGEVLGLTERTIKDDWKRAKLFLLHALAPQSSAENS